MDEQNQTPEAKATMFEQAQYCDTLVRDKVGVRDADLKSGMLRWKCGDVDGVTFDTQQGAGFGQEDREYHAVSNGAIIDDNARPNAPVECVFTSVFANSNQDIDALATKLSTTLASVDASHSTAPPDAAMAGMQIGFNSEGAAIQLISDCQAAGETMSFVNAERQTACFTAWKTASPANKQTLKNACQPADLANDATWQAVLALNLGVTELTPASPDYEVTEDVAVCAHGHDLGRKIVAWRNSDPTICARVSRAAHECGDTFATLPRDLPGFAMTSWVDDFDPATPPVAPSGCKYVDVDGKPFQQLLVCTPAPDKVAQAKLAGKVMQTMCKEEFGSLIAMQAPLGAVVHPGDKHTAFCDEFNAGVRALQGTH